MGPFDEARAEETPLALPLLPFDQQRLIKHVVQVVYSPLSRRRKAVLQSTRLCYHVGRFPPGDFDQQEADTAPLNPTPRVAHESILAPMSHLALGE